MYFLWILDWFNPNSAILGLAAMGPWSGAIQVEGLGLTCE